MNDIASPPAFVHLSPAQSRLAGLAARPKPVAIACIVTLTALGWAACGFVLTDPANTWSALCAPTLSAGWSVAETSIVLGMWAAMALAMMLPTASPMVLTYAEIADTAARVGERAASPLALVGGYLTVWFAFALAATLLQLLLATRAADAVGSVPPTIAGTIVLAAGAYQFSSFKHACLDLCQRPFPFFFANWTETTRGVFRLGLRQGVYCLGCCWALMLVMVAVGAMNVLWMAVLGALMTLEKMTATNRLSHALGFALIVVGIALIASGMI